MKVKNGGLAAGNYAEKALRQNEGWKKQRVYKELKKCFTMVEEKYNGFLHLSRQIQGCCRVFFFLLFFNNFFLVVLAAVC